MSAPPSSHSSRSSEYPPSTRSTASRASPKRQQGQPDDGRPCIGFSWSTGNRTNWISGQDEGGCGAGITGVGTENGGSDPSNPIVGAGGGYGGIYCFAMKP
jgi:hypothetical protein